MKIRSHGMLAALVVAFSLNVCSASTPAPAHAQIILKMNFQDFTTGFTKCDVSLGNSHPNVFLKPSGHPVLNGKQLIRVNEGGATMRVRLVPDAASAARGPYRPIAIYFERIDPVDPRGVAPGASDSPFSNIRIVGDELEFRNMPVPKQTTNGQPFRTFKFSVVVQRVSDGAIGIIDPDIENQNPP